MTHEEFMNILDEHGDSGIFCHVTIHTDEAKGPYITFLEGPLSQRSIYLDRYDLKKELDKS